MRIPAEQFNADGHWYTSYPSLNHWGAFSHREYVDSLRGYSKPLHLYLHIPFCAKLCHYCICNIIVSNDRQKIQYFLDHLLKEIDLLKGLGLTFKDLHFGGGTPSHLDRNQFIQLVDKLNELVPLKSLDEVAMEIDPRTVTQEDLRLYASLGITRISFGVQDFDARVQASINRIQPPEMIEALLTPEIRKLFKGINFDLLYGLPFQTLGTIRKTVERVIDFSPDRITLLKYCHAPEIRKHMQLIRVEDLPNPEDLPVMFSNMVESLTYYGYKWVGLDHFALPSDRLYNRSVRTFNGFSSGTQEMIGVGPTTTGTFGNVYCQAHYNLTEYYDSINRGEFPIFRGYSMSEDDLLRREVIFSLLCTQEVMLTPYFNPELRVLGEMKDLVEVNGYHVKATALGRFLLRNICKVFDTKDVRAEHKKISQYTIKRIAA